MLNKYTLIKWIVTSIDRIELSLPLRYWADILKQIKYECHQDKIIHKDKKEIITFLRKTKRIHIWKYQNQKVEKKYQRFSIELFQPDTATLKFIQNLVINNTQIKSSKQFNPTINQFELAFDFIPTKAEHTDELKKFINQHLYVKHARTGSVGRIKETDYRGKDGNKRLGAKGFTMYCKEKDRIQFARLELQLNRKYLRDKKIDIDNLCNLNPSQFNLFDHVEFLDDFSEKGLFNIARTIVRKRGYLNDNSRNYRLRVNVHRHLLKRRIFASVLYKKNCVAEQVDGIKNLKKQKGINCNIKNYCKPLEDFTSLVQEKLSSTKEDIKETKNAVNTEEDFFSNHIGERATPLINAVVERIHPMIVAIKRGATKDFAWTASNRGNLYHGCRGAPL